MIRFLDGTRIMLIIIGFFLAYLFLPHALFFLLILVALPLNLIYCIEYSFCATASARSKGREPDRAYQLQSAYFWLTMTIMIILALFLPLDRSVQLMLYYITLLFFFFASIGHLFESFKHSNTSIRRYHQLRFVLIIILILVSIPAIISIINGQSVYNK